MGRRLTAAPQSLCGKREAKAAMDRFKTEVASEMGINLKEGYNGDLTSREAGLYVETKYILRKRKFIEV